MKPEDLRALIPDHVRKGCDSYETDEDGDARASVEILTGNHIILHIHTENSHWERRVRTKEYLSDISAHWAEGLRWLNV